MKGEEQMPGEITFPFEVNVESLLRPLADLFIMHGYSSHCKSTYMA